MRISDVGNPGPQSSLPGVRYEHGEEMFGVGQAFKLPDLEWKYVGWAAILALITASFFFLKKATDKAQLGGLGRACRRR